MTDIKHIADLIPDPHNAREHNPRNVGMIEKALQEVGAARSIVIDENGKVLAGNATIEAAALAGIEDVQVIEADGETIIAVRRSGLTEEQKRRLALYDNRTAELADWDAEVLAAIKLDDDGTLDGLFQDWELNKVLGEYLSDIDHEAEWQGMPEFEQEDLSPFRQLIVSFKCQDDVAAFAEKIGQKLTDKTRSVWYPQAEIMHQSLVIEDD